MKTLHVVSHTHWDREWYLPFQEFRFRLVGLLDRLLDLLEQDPDYRSFTLDGQTIILDDYLEIRPEQEGRIRQLVQDGRLLVGPWYILPDEFLEGPEAMVRNLLFGWRGCRRFSDEPQPMERIGYIPDPFGHVSQLPQIAAGFELDALCFWRGVADAPTEFQWAAPDGTQRLVLHLRDSYSNGAWLAVDEEGFNHDLATERDALAPYATTSHLLVMQGTDHMEPRPDLPARLRAAEPTLGDRVIHSNLPAYLAAVRAELDDEGSAGLPLLWGELRSPQRAHLLPAVLSARMWIKQWNAGCEILLTRWAEPFSALAEQVAGTTAQRGFQRKAWEWLLKNHPHDSICGCSTDQVHREMRTRFAWAEQIADQVTQASLEAIGDQINTQHPLPGQSGEAASRTEPGATIIVFNPTAAPRTDRVRARVKLLLDGDWTLVDADGQPMPHRVLGAAVRERFGTSMDREALADWLDRVEAGQGRIFGDLFLHDLKVSSQDGLTYVEVTAVDGPGAASPGEVLRANLDGVRTLLAGDRIQRYHVRVAEELGLDVEFLARDVPGIGYKQFRMHPSQVPIAQSPIAQSPTSIENGFFVVEAEPADGTLTVTDKATGLVLRGVNRFVDGGDRGDEYTYCPPERDLLVDTPVAPPTIRRVDDGVGSTLEITMVYRLPRALADGDRSVRGNDLVELPITSRATLTPGVRRVEFEVTVDNRAEDHRLRVHFPTPIVTDRSWSESHFDVVERPIALPSGTGNWAEQPVGTHPQLTFVDVTDGQRGVLLANRGLPEYEILPGTDDASGVTIALTLLRCVGWLSRGDLPNRDGHAGPAVPTPEAQCPGEHIFHYALVPHPGNYLTAQREAHAFNSPLRAVCTDPHGGPLPSRASFLEVSPAAVVVSALKSPETGEGMILRIYNSAPTPVQAQLKLWRRFRSAARVLMSERTALGDLARESDTVSLPLRAKEIGTLHFMWGPKIQQADES